MSLGPQRNISKKISGGVNGKGGCDKEKLNKVLDILNEVSEKLLSLQKEKEIDNSRIDEIIKSLAEIDKIINKLLES